jgi:hypothetical protein
MKEHPKNTLTVAVGGRKIPAAACPATTFDIVQEEE